MRRFISFYAPSVALVAFVTYKYQIDYSYDDFKNSLSFLATISGVVFTIMGIWIALIYPQAISKIVAPQVIETADFTDGLRDTKRLESLVGSILKSISVLFFVLVIFLCKTIFYNTSIYLNNIILIKSAALSMLIAMTFIQLEAIWHVVDSNISFLNDLHAKREDRERDMDV